MTGAEALGSGGRVVGRGKVVTESGCGRDGCFGCCSGGIGECAEELRRLFDVVCGGGQNVMVDMVGGGEGGLKGRERDVAGDLLSCERGPDGQSTANTFDDKHPEPAIFLNHPHRPRAVLSIAVRHNCLSSSSLHTSKIYALSAAHLPSQLRAPLGTLDL